MTSLDDLFSYFESFTNLEVNRSLVSTRTFRLDRMNYLLELFGNPHRCYKTLHVAGSKGKGSVSMLLASALTGCGFMTGLYLSPHINSYRERITVNLETAEPELLLKLGQGIREVIEQINLEAVSDYTFPTTFELLTLLAFLYYREAGCEYVVLETGLGGRLDATNVVIPEASIITMIEKEHTEILGDTLEKIAFEKGGIIKPGVPLFTSAAEPDVQAVLRELCRERGAEYHYLRDVAGISGVNISRQGTSFSLASNGEEPVVVSIPLIGEFQAENGALAWQVLKSCCGELPVEKILEGFRLARLPGRFEVIENRGQFILDGAHTPGSVEKILEIYRQLFPQKGILIFGVVKDKDYAAMARKLAPAFQEIIISTPGTFRESDPDGVFGFFKELNPNTHIEREPGKALALARELGREGELPVLVTGSFYMVAEIRKFLV